MKLLHPKRSDAFEILEGFEAVRATVRSLAGRGTEFADQFGVLRCTSRTGNVALALQQGAFAAAFLRRRYAVVAQFLATDVGDPVGRPRRRQHALDGDVVDTAVFERRDHAGLDDLGRRTTRVGRRQRNNNAVTAFHVAYDAEIRDAQHRNLGVRHLGQPLENRARDLTTGSTTSHPDSCAAGSASRRQVTEMLGVPALLAAACHFRVPLECVSVASSTIVGDVLLPLGGDRAEVRAVKRRLQSRRRARRRRTFRPCKRHELVQGLLRPAVTLLGAVTEPDQPLTAVAQMVANLFLGAHRDFCEAPRRCNASALRAMTR